jgi:hypothetical protein
VVHSCLRSAGVEPEDVAGSADGDNGDGDMIEIIDKNGKRKMRRKRRSKKSQLEDAYPLGIQRLFFHGARAQPGETPIEMAITVAPLEERGAPTVLRSDSAAGAHSQLAGKAADALRAQLAVCGYIF